MQNNFEYLISSKKFKSSIVCKLRFYIMLHHCVNQSQNNFERKIRTCLSLDEQGNEIEYGNQAYIECRSCGEVEVWSFD